MIDKTLKEFDEQTEKSDQDNGFVNYSYHGGTFYNIGKIKAFIQKALEEQEKQLKNECAKTVAMMGNEFKKKLEEQVGNCQNLLIAKEKEHEETRIRMNGSYMRNITNVKKRLRLSGQDIGNLLISLNVKYVDIPDLAKGLLALQNKRESGVETEVDQVFYDKDSN